MLSMMLNMAIYLIPVKNVGLRLPFWDMTTMVKNELRR
jgi:hypothetical protein